MPSVPRHVTSATDNRKPGAEAVCCAAAEPKERPHMTESEMENQYRHVINKAAQEKEKQKQSEASGSSIGMVTNSDM